MLDLVGNPENRFSRVAAHLISDMVIVSLFLCREGSIHKNCSGFIVFDLPYALMLLHCYSDCHVNAYLGL